MWHVVLLRLFSDVWRSGTQPNMLWTIGVTSGLTAGLTPDLKQVRLAAARSASA